MECGTFKTTKREDELAEILAECLFDDGWHIMEDTMYASGIDKEAERKSLKKLIKRLIEW